MCVEVAGDKFVDDGEISPVPHFLNGTAHQHFVLF
jgi:hypothetical protein